MLFTEIIITELFTFQNYDVIDRYDNEDEIPDSLIVQEIFIEKNCQWVVRHRSTI